MPLLVCPNCNVGMLVVQRSGIELDTCPQCRGVWLDRGELEKMLQPIRAEAARQHPAESPWNAPAHDKGKHHGHVRPHHPQGEQQRRKGGWDSLLDIFD